MKAMEMNERAQGQYLEVEKDWFKYGESRRISKGHSELGAETQKAVWQKPRKK